MRILLTGIDGSGKSTAARELVRLIGSQGHAVRLVNTSAGRRTMNAWWAALGWAPGARAQDRVESTVRAVNAVVSEIRLRGFDGVVVLDRGLMCQLALRVARGLPQGVVLPRLQRLLRAPELIVYFDVPVEVALERVRKRATDQETLADLSALAEGYRTLPEYGSFSVIDADRPACDVLRDLLVLTGHAQVEPFPENQVVSC